MPVKFFDADLITDSPVAVGIDQSLTGFALTVLNVDSPTNYCTWVYKSKYSGVQRLSDIGGWIVDRLEEIEKLGCEIQEIAMEGTVLASHSALVLGELAALVKLTIWEFFIENGHESHLRRPLQIPPMTIKKYASGKGNSKKQEMLLQIYKRWGIEFNDDNAADSYALARLAAGVSIDATETAIVEQIKDLKYRDSLL